MKALTIAALAILSATQIAAQGKPAETVKKDPPPAAIQPTNVSGKAVDLPAPAKIAATADFSEKYDEYVALMRVMDQIEQENGIPKMRQRSQQMVGQLQSWMKDHKVDGWAYDPATKTFSEPPKRTPVPAVEKPTKN